MGRLRGMFHRDECCDTGGGCNAGNTCNTCDSGCGGGWRAKMHGWFHRDDSCDTCSNYNYGCDSCGGGCGLRAKLRGWFHRDSGDTCGCDTCGTGAHGGTMMPGAPVGAPKAEPIPAPKEAPAKMPNAEKKAEIITPRPFAPGRGLTLETEIK